MKPLLFVIVSPRQLHKIKKLQFQLLYNPRNTTQPLPHKCLYSYLAHLLLIFSYHYVLFHLFFVHRFTPVRTKCTINMKSRVLNRRRRWRAHFAPIDAIGVVQMTRANIQLLGRVMPQAYLSRWSSNRCLALFNYLNKKTLTILLSNIIHIHTYVCAENALRQHLAGELSASRLWNRHYFDKFRISMNISEPMIVYRRTLMSRKSMLLINSGKAPNV